MTDTQLTNITQATADYAAAAAAWTAGNKDATGAYNAYSAAVTAGSPPALAAAALKLSQDTQAAINQTRAVYQAKAALASDDYSAMVAKKQALQLAIEDSMQSGYDPAAVI